jgi:putative spermidine/putrescine transport system permease protein
MNGPEFSLRWFKAVFEPRLRELVLEQPLAGPGRGHHLHRAGHSGGHGAGALSASLVGALQGLFLSPLIIPHLVLGVALLRLFSVVGGAGSFGWLVLAHSLVVTPYTMRLIMAALIGFDRSAEQAALSLGAHAPRYSCASRCR